jgi:hypothetical protein
MGSFDSIANNPTALQSEIQKRAAFIQRVDSGTYSGSFSSSQYTLFKNQLNELQGLYAKFTYPESQSSSFNPASPLVNTTSGSWTNVVQGYIVTKADNQVYTRYTQPIASGGLSYMDVPQNSQTQISFKSGEPLYLELGDYGIQSGSPILTQTNNSFIPTGYALTPAMKVSFFSPENIASKESIIQKNINEVIPSPIINQNKGVPFELTRSETDSLGFSHLEFRGDTTNPIQTGINAITYSPFVMGATGFVKDIGIGIGSSAARLTNPANYGLTVYANPLSEFNKRFWNVSVQKGYTQLSSLGIREIKSETGGRAFLKTTYKQQPLTFGGDVLTIGTVAVLPWAARTYPAVRAGLAGFGIVHGSYSYFKNPTLKQAGASTAEALLFSLDYLPKVRKIDIPRSKGIGFIEETYNAKGELIKSNDFGKNSLYVVSMEFSPKKVFILGSVNPEGSGFRTFTKAPDINPILNEMPSNQVKLVTRQEEPAKVSELWMSPKQKIISGVQEFQQSIGLSPKSQIIERTTRVVFEPEIPLSTATDTKLFGTNLIRNPNVASPQRAKEFVSVAQSLLGEYKNTPSAYIRDLPSETERLNIEGTNIVLGQAIKYEGVLKGSYVRQAQLSQEYMIGLGTSRTPVRFTLNKVPRDIDVELIGKTPEEIKFIAEETLGLFKNKGIKARLKGEGGMVKNAIEVLQPTGKYEKAVEFLGPGTTPESEIASDSVLGFKKEGPRMKNKGVTTTTLSEELRGVTQGIARVRMTEKGIDIYPSEKRTKDIGSVTVSVRTLYQSKPAKYIWQIPRRAKALKNIEKYESMFPQDLVREQLLQAENVVLPEKRLLANYSPETPSKSFFKDYARFPLQSVNTKSDEQSTRMRSSRSGRASELSLSRSVARSSSSVLSPVVSMSPSVSSKSVSSLSISSQTPSVSPSRTSSISPSRTPSSYRSVSPSRSPSISPSPSLIPSSSKSYTSPISDFTPASGGGTNKKERKKMTFLKKGGNLVPNPFADLISQARSFTKYGRVTHPRDTQKLRTRFYNILTGRASGIIKTVEESRRRAR